MRLTWLCMHMTGLRMHLTWLCMRLTGLRMRLTRLRMRQGYAVYVDGVLRGALQAPRAYFHVDGGAPLNVTGDWVLCGRADGAAGRTFDGRIAQLSFFDNALSAFEARPHPAAARARLRVRACSAGSALIRLHERALAQHPANLRTGAAMAGPLPVVCVLWPSVDDPTAGGQTHQFLQGRRQKRAWRLNLASAQVRQLYAAVTGRLPSAYTLAPASAPAAGPAADAYDDSDLPDYPLLVPGRGIAIGGALPGAVSPAAGAPASPVPNPSVPIPAPGAGPRSLSSVHVHVSKQGRFARSRRWPCDAARPTRAVLSGQGAGFCSGAGRALRLPGARRAGVRGVGATESAAADALRPQTGKGGARVGAIVGAVFVRGPRCAACLLVARAGKRDRPSLYLYLPTVDSWDAPPHGFPRMRSACAPVSACC